MSNRRRLVLASASPRRRELLETMGIDFVVRPVDLDESPLTGESPHDLVLRLAQGKAMAEAHPGEIVLAADTIVVIDGRILGKPTDRADARRLLTDLEGREHTVLTGVAIVDPDRGESRAAVDRTSVRIGPLASEQIAWYVDTGEPLDKAGAYAIQGLGAAFVESIRGNYTNVVGLPLPTVGRLMADLELNLFHFRR